MFIRSLVFVLGLCILAPVSLAAEKKPEKKEWWAEGGFRRPEPDPRAKLLPLISVSGNHFVNPQGETVLFRGLSIADPDKLVDQNQWQQEIFAAVKAAGANIIRLPVHPVAWRERGRADYLLLLDQAVAWATDLGLYVLIDWHTIGNLKTGMFQNPMYETDTQETFAFWRTIAQRYREHNTVAFYEFFNEPTHFNGMLGAMSWAEWRALNEEMIGIVRYWDKETIPIVSGFDWAYDLTGVRFDPVRAAGIAYSSHPYAFKRTEPWEPKWDENFGFVAANYPVVVTEFGFGLREGEEITDAHYGNRITRYLEQRGMSWIAWCFDPAWGPPLLKGFAGYELNRSGAFFKQALQRPPATSAH